MKSISFLSLFLLAAINYRWQGTHLGVMAIQACKVFPAIRFVWMERV